MALAVLGLSVDQDSPAHIDPPTSASQRPVPPNPALVFNSSPEFQPYNHRSLGYFLSNHRSLSGYCDWLGYTSDTGLSNHRHHIVKDRWTLWGFGRGFYCSHQGEPLGSCWTNPPKECPAESGP